MTADRAAPRARRRRARLARVRAILAGALVLGVGATVTLASWVDNENATGTFTTSTFNTESSPDGTTWADNTSAPGATLTVNAGAISPGYASAAPFAIRGKTSSVAGTAALATPATAGNAALGAALQYRAYVTTSAANCVTAPTAGQVTAWLVGSAGPVVLNTAVAANSTPLAAATSTAAGAPTWFCFVLSLPSGASNSLQGATASATWHFTTTSTT